MRLCRLQASCSPWRFFQHAPIVEPTAIVGWNGGLQCQFDLGGRDFSEAVLSDQAQNNLMADGIIRPIDRDLSGEAVPCGDPEPSNRPINAPTQSLLAQVTMPESLERNELQQRETWAREVDQHS